MTSDTIDTTELRLLSNILALVLDEQPGQATAALDMLRRRAAASRVTGGALKNLFDRIAQEAAADTGIQRGARAEAHRLQQELESATVQASRFAAENAALHHSLADAERRLARYDAGEMAQRRELVGVARAAQPRPPERRNLAVALVGGAVIAMMAMLLNQDQPPVPLRRPPVIARAWPPPPPSGSPAPRMAAEMFGPPAPQVFTRLP